jgi:uncharacterized protein YbaR (Trm112 family)
MTRDTWLIIPMAIPIVILGVFMALRISESRKLTRMRQLACPDCRTPFAVAGLTAVRHWVDFNVDRQSARSGFTLYCQHCAAYYRFSDDFEFVARDEQKG